MKTLLYESLLDMHDWIVRETTHDKIIYDVFCMFRHLSPEDWMRGWNFDFINKAENGSRYVAYYSPELITVTYCEGDLTMVKYPTRKAFDKNLKESEEFYLTN